MRKTGNHMSVSNTQSYSVILPECKKIATENKSLTGFKSCDTSDGSTDNAAEPPVEDTHL